MGTIGMLMLGFAIGRRYEQRQREDAELDAPPAAATVASGYVDASPYVRAARRAHVRQRGRR